MSYYNTFLETYNAFQCFGLLPEDKQTSTFQNFNYGWAPAVINEDLRFFDIIFGYSLRRFYFVDNKIGFPWIPINKEMVDVMTTAVNDYGVYNQDAYVEFIFQNYSSLRICVTGTPGNRLSLTWYLWDYNTQTGTAPSSSTSDYTYESFVAFDALGSNFILFPAVLHVIDTSDPSYDWKECDIFFSTETYINSIKDEPQFYRIEDDVNIDIVQLFNQNNWASMPDFWFSDNEAAVDVDYPPEDEDDEGGYGSGTDVNDFIDFPDAPTVSALGTGLIHIYTPDNTQMQAFSAWLWSSGYATNVEKLQISPMENLLVFGFLPQVMNSALDTIFIGHIDTQIACNTASSQYCLVSCGSINIPEFYGSFLDYDAEYQIFLPYIGYKPMKADDFTKGSIEVKYWVDILTGTCSAFVMCKNEHVLYAYTGNCFTELPISGANYARMKQGQMNAVAGGVMSFVGNTVKGVMGGAAAGPAGAIAGGIAGAASSLPSVINAKQQFDLQRPDYERGGGLAGNTQFMIRKPYIIQTRVKAKYPSNYKSLKGIPSKGYHYLKDLSGFTKIDTVIVDSLIHCTKEEKAEIIALLKEGVIL